MIQIFPNLEELSRAAAHYFMEQATAAITSYDQFVVALSGGNTPKRLYQLLAEAPYRDQIDWQKVHVFWGDERCVPTDDLRRNEKMSRQILFDHVPISPENIHPIRCEQDPFRAAQNYEEEIEEFFHTAAPVFDLILLGLGENAHTASLFPYTEVLHEQKHWVSALYVAEQKMYRVTMTAPLINQARQILFLVSGGEKTTALKNVLEGDEDVDKFPAQLIKPHASQPLWLIDQAAAAELTLMK